MTVETIEEQSVAVRRWASPPWFTWARWGLEGTALLALLGFLVFDRVRLFQEFLIKFVDEDQGIEWYAARELLRGHLHEPCFFGQSYNSNIEGYLAAPLVAAGMPYLYAVPLVTVLLGLLPFLLMAAVAWRRRQPVVAAISLMLPAVLSTRYGIITGMPRGFVTGDAFAIIPALLFLPPARKTLFTPMARPRRPGTPWWRRALAAVGRWFVPPPVALRRTWPKTRYFFAGFFAVVALMFNPNCAVLLAGVAVYGLLTTWREWRFLLFTTLGLLAAAPYYWLVQKFYFDWHTDYRLYQAFPEKRFDWSWAHFYQYLRSLADLGFHDLIPDALYKLAQSHVRAAPAQHLAGGAATFVQNFNFLHRFNFLDKYPSLHDLGILNFLGLFDSFTPQAVGRWIRFNPAPTALLIAFAVAALLLLLRVRLAAILAALATVALVLVSFAYSRIEDGRSGASFPYSRMFLAVPIAWVWILLLINPPALQAPRWHRWRWLAWWKYTTQFCRRWITPALAIAAMFLCVWFAAHVVMQKNRTLADDIADINDDSQVARPVTVDETLHIARAVQAAAEREHISLVVISGYEGRKWDYTLPELTTCETLFPNYERRTWRLEEECYPRYDKILVLGNIPVRQTPHFRSHTLVSRDPPLAVFPLNGQSVATFCQEMGIPFREPFNWPDVPGQPKHPGTSQPRARGARR